MTTTKYNEHKKLNFSSEREQSQACLNSAEHEKNQGRKVLNVPNLRFPEFKGEWKKTTIGEIATIKNGPFGSVLHAEDYVDEGMPIVTTEHFKSGNLPLSKNGIPQVSEDDYYRLKGYMLETDDIVFSRVGSVDINAHVEHVQQGWLFSGRVLRVRPIKSVNSLCLHYVLSTESVKRDIRNRAVGQTMPSINTPILSNTGIYMSQSEAEQKKIANLLSLIDERISTQNKIIDKLQSLIKGINQEVFNEVGCSHKLGSICEIKSGYSGNQLIKKEGLKVSRIETISGHQINLERVGYVSPFKNSESYKLQVGDILFSNINSVEYIGNTAFVDKDYDLYHGMNLLRLIPNSKIVVPFYLYLLLNTRKMLNRFKTICNKAVSQASINQTDLGKTIIVLPSLENQIKICNIYEVLFSKIEAEKKCLSLYNVQKQYLLRQMFI